MRSWLLSVAPGNASSTQQNRFCSDGRILAWFCVHSLSAHFPNLLLQNSYESMKPFNSYDSLLGHCSQFLMGFVEIQHLIKYGHVRRPYEGQISWGGCVPIDWSSKLSNLLILEVHQVILYLASVSKLVGN